MPTVTQRPDTIHPLTAANGLAVAVTPEGERGWLICVRNETPDLVQVMWDESTFVMSDGESMGRIMRGDYGTTWRSGMLDVARSATRGGTAQAPSPIAAGAAMTAWIVPESYVGEDGTPAPGRLTIRFRRGTATESWTGDVVSPVVVDAPGVGWWCTTPADDSAPSLCARSEDRCDRLTASERWQGADVGECTTRDQVACMVRIVPGGEPTSSCFSSLDQCAASARAAATTQGAAPTCTPVD